MIGNIFDAAGDKNMSGFALFLAEDGLCKYDFTTDTWVKIEFERRIWKITNGGTTSHIFTRDGLYECDGTTTPMKPTKTTKSAIDIKYGNGFIIVQTPIGLYGTGNNCRNQLCQSIKAHMVNRLAKLSFDRPVHSVACGRDEIIINSPDGLFESTPGGVDKIEFPHEVLQLVGHDGDYIIHTPVGLFGRGPNYFGALGMGHFRPVDHFTIIQFNPPNITSLYCGRKSSFVLTSDGLYSAGNNLSPSAEGDQRYTSLFIRVPIDDEILSVTCVRSEVIVNTASDTLICKHGKFVSIGKKVIEPGATRFAATKSARS